VGVGRAHDWAQRIARGEIRTLRELITHSGLSKQTVHQTLRLAVLFPQNTLAILNGVRPPELTLASLSSLLRPDWLEQGLVRA